jgi:hypothetical protein
LEEARRFVLAVATRPPLNYLKEFLTDAQSCTFRDSLHLGR